MDGRQKKQDEKLGKREKQIQILKAVLDQFQFYMELNERLKPVTTEATLNNMVFDKLVDLCEQIEWKMESLRPKSLIDITSSESEAE